MKKGCQHYAYDGSASNVIYLVWASTSNKGNW
jgi:hypothetical protein